MKVSSIIAARTRKQSSSWMKRVFEFVGILCGAMIGLVLGTMVFGTAVVEGTSMQPTLRSHDYVLVNKYTLAWGGLRRGDVIFLRWDGEDSESKDDIVVKRVVGLPGDQVEIRGGQVYLNREILDEPYVDNKMGGENFSYVVPEDSVFVMGDNRGNSEDSRDRGPVSMRNIIGKAACVIWPLRRLGKI